MTQKDDIIRVQRYEIEACRKEIENLRATLKLTKKKLNIANENIKCLKNNVYNKVKQNLHPDQIISGTE